jgi:hypothetical protein
MASHPIPPFPGGYHASQPPLEAPRPGAGNPAPFIKHRNRRWTGAVSPRVRIACYVLLAIASGFCAFVFGISGGSLTVAAIPLTLLSLAALWTMPDMRYPPVKLIRALLTLLLFFYLCWPDYIALVFGDLPWISATRLVGIPLMAALLVCAFGSSGFRRQVADISQGDKLTVWLFIGTFAYAALSIGFSINPSYSVDRLGVYTYTALVPFFAAMFLFNTAGRMRTFAWVNVVITVYNLIVAFMEAHNQKLPWSDNIPSFLRIDDPMITMRLAGTARAATNEYRVGGRFSNPIGLGEYLSFALPFILHLLFTERSKLAKLAMLSIIPPMFYIVLKTGSRLGFIGFASAIVLYVFYQAFIIWRRRPTSIFAPAVMLAYPVAMAAFVVLALFWGRLHIKIFGGGAAQFSTQARQEQWAQGIPLIGKAPWGHGIGSAAEVLNYTAIGSDFPTIDSYYLSILLDFGVLGFIAFYAMFVWSGVRSGLAALQTRDADTSYLAPIAIALANFVIGKSVYSQQENHIFAFLLLGASVALLRRYAAETGKLPPPPLESTLHPPLTDDYAMDWERRPEMLG